MMIRWLYEYTINNNDDLILPFTDPELVFLLPSTSFAK